MKNFLPFICLAVLLSGCATTDYYTNPNSAGYYQQGLGGLCQNCNRQFAISAHQLNNVENTTCPYCGTTQNTKMASNRYTYEAQKAQTVANAQFAGGLAKTLQNSMNTADERRRQTDQQTANSIMQGFQPNRNNTTTTRTNDKIKQNLKCHPRHRLLLLRTNLPFLVPSILIFLISFASFLFLI